MDKLSMRIIERHMFLSGYHTYNVLYRESDKFTANVNGKTLTYHVSGMLG